MKVQRILSPGKQPDRVTARSVPAYWVVRELGISEVKNDELRKRQAHFIGTVGKQLSLSQSATSRAVERGEQIIAQRWLSLHKEANA